MVNDVEERAKGHVLAHPPGKRNHPVECISRELAPRGTSASIGIRHLVASSRIAIATLVKNASFFTLLLQYRTAVSDFEEQLGHGVG